VQVVRAVGVDGARASRGLVVVVDVLRAFTLSAYALAGGARECLLVRTVDEARELAAQTPGAVLSAEVDTLPVPGIAISNSPTQIQRTDVRGRSVIQRTSAGTQVINSVPDGHDIYAASLVVARATAQACLLRRPDAVTVVASADYPEDHACAAYIESILIGAAVPLEVDQLLQPLFDSPRYRQLAAGGWPGFPASDLELALVADRFDFAMPAGKGERYVRLTKQPLQESAAAAVNGA
jgi:2-phosphosulfolactate phosphatase